MTNTVTFNGKDQKIFFPLSKVDVCLNCLLLSFQAAGHVHRFRSLDENILRMSEESGEGMSPW